MSTGARSKMAALGSWHQRAESDPRRDARAASLMGMALGVCFSVCFLTGLYSHLAQHPPSWFTLPAQPAGLYRVTQGVHVATGIATIPLLLAKLWAVFPKLLRLPPITDIAHLIERVALVPLVGGAVFMLFSGVANIDLWYPLPFFFPTAHYWVAWLTIGALVVHLGAKIPTVRESVFSRTARRASSTPSIARRQFLTFVAAGSGLLTIATVGETVGPLRRLALLAPRSPDIGDSGFPVNGAAAEAHVVDAATDPAWRLKVTGDIPQPVELSRSELEAMALHEAELPIACVEGWSASRIWRGIRVVDLLDLVGAPPGAHVTVHSLENGLYAQSEINATQAHHPDTLLALEADGQTLSLDHGYPLRLIGPNRPGVMQTKWLTGFEVHA